NFTDGHDHSEFGRKLSAIVTSSSGPLRAFCRRANLPAGSICLCRRPNPMSRVLAVTAVGLALCAVEPLRVATVHAAGQGGATATQTAAQSPASARVPDRALLDKYCVTCHNDRLKTGGLALEKVDVDDV